jgi:hypothetical protein
MPSPQRVALLLIGGFGLNWGRGTVSVSLTVLIVGLVGYLSVTRLDVEKERERQPVGELA